LVSTNHLAEPVEGILGLVAYGLLFALTIWQNRRNRALILGVLTVGLFAGFLFYAHLVEKHTPAWLPTTVAAFIVLVGLSLLAFVLLDVFRWASGKREPDARGNDPSAKSGLEAK